MERAVYFDAWYPRHHCYHPSLPPRRLRMIEDLQAYRATALVWSALGGGSISLPYLGEEAWGAVGPRAWLGRRESPQNTSPKLWKPLEHYFPGGLVNSDGETVTDLLEECVSR